MPNKYGNISEIAQYNRENGTNFYTMEQVEQHRKENNPSFLKRLAQTTVQVPVTSGVSTSTATSLRDIPKVESTVGNELGYAAGLLTTPMLLGEIGTYGPLVGALRLGAGTAGSAAGSYIAGKAGDFADKKFGTNWIGDTGRILGGFAGFGAGMKTTTPLIRSAATRGLTLHMPQDTFIKVRGEGFDRAFNKVNTNLTTEMKLAIRDSMMDNYLSFGSRNGEPNRLIHWDPMTIGTKEALPINGGNKLPETKFTHISGDNFVPAEGEITSKVGDRSFAHHTSDEHPIFFGKNQPWREVPNKNLEQYFSDAIPDKSIYSGPKQNFDRWWKRQRLNAKRHRQWYDKYGIQNQGQRYLTVNPEDVSYIDNENIGVMVPKVKLSKVEGFEYDPTTSTFNKVRYINPKQQTGNILGELEASSEKGWNHKHFKTNTYFGEYLGSGAESDVYQSPFTNDVIKISSGLRSTPNEAVNSSIIYMRDRNKVPFLQKPIERIGIMRFKDKYTPVYKQETVKPLSNVTADEWKNIKSVIDSRMKANGYVKDLSETYKSPNGKAIHFWDFKDENFGIDKNGDLFAIDLDIFKQGGILKAQKGKSLMR